MYHPGTKCQVISGTQTRDFTPNLGIVMSDRYQHYYLFFSRNELYLVFTHRVFGSKKFSKVYRHKSTLPFSYTNSYPKSQNMRAHSIFASPKCTVQVHRSITKFQQISCKYLLNKLPLNESVLSQCLVSLEGEDIRGDSWSFHSPTWKWHSFYWPLLSFPYLLRLPSTPTQTRGTKVKRESSSQLVSISSLLPSLTSFCMVLFGLVSILYVRMTLFQGVGCVCMKE